MNEPRIKRHEKVTPPKNQIENKEEAKKLGDTIRFQRLKLGFSQTELGVLINKNTTYISKIELSTISPKYEVLQRIAKVFRLKTYELLIKSHLDNGLPEIEAEMSTAHIKKISNWINKEILKFKSDRDKLKMVNPN